MRIISQNGLMDVPYEQVVIRRFNGRIYFLSRNLPGPERFTTDDTVLADYYTEAKAIKAMEMLHEAYLSYCTARPDEYWFAFNQPKVFQFPKNEDVKVKD